MHRPSATTTQRLRSMVGRGVLRHRRARPFVYAFRHRVWYLAIDLDELEDLAGRIRILSLDRWNLLSFHRADHFAPNDASLADAVRQYLQAQGVLHVDGSIVLVTYPRVLGYVFNPVSFYLCHDRSGALRAVLAEVNNTHGDQTVYTFQANDQADGRFASRQDKRFYVSPFLSLDGRYEFVYSHASGGSTFTVNEFEGAAGPLNLHTSLTLEWRPLTTWTLLRTWARRPLMTLQTIGLIHLHALRLWRRRAPFFKYDPTRAGTPGHKG
ncbi:MAG: DUF1365 domain-containing protein [Dehalococcoidia bacterium]